MSATITDGTTTWSRTLSPLPNAPWFFDGFSLDKFGVIIRTTSGAVRNGVFDFTISNLSYTGGTAAARQCRATTTATAWSTQPTTCSGEKAAR